MKEGERKSGIYVTNGWSDESSILDVEELLLSACGRGLRVVRPGSLRSKKH